MTYFAAALVLCVCVVVLALWDASRRALASQVRTAELRVEAMTRADWTALRAELEAVKAASEKTARELATLDTSIALGRKGR